MFFKFDSGKEGIIKSISIDVNKLDVSVKDHLMEFLKGKVKIVDGKIIIKCDMTFEELKVLNDGYNEFHSRFILDNVIPSKLQIEDNKEMKI